MRLPRPTLVFWLCAGICKVALLVVLIIRDSTGITILSSFSSFLRRQLRCRQWPGCLHSVPFFSRTSAFYLFYPSCFALKISPHWSREKRGPSLRPASPPWAWTPWGGALLRTFPESAPLKRCCWKSGNLKSSRYLSLGPWRLILGPSWPPHWLLFILSLQSSWFPGPAALSRP